MASNRITISSPGIAKRYKRKVTLSDKFIRREQNASPSSRSTSLFSAVSVPSTKGSKRLNEDESQPDFDKPASSLKPSQSWPMSSRGFKMDTVQRTEHPGKNSEQSEVGRCMNERYAYDKQEQTQALPASQMESNYLTNDKKHVTNEINRNRSRTSTITSSSTTCLHEGEISTVKESSSNSLAQYETGDGDRIQRVSHQARKEMTFVVRGGKKTTTSGVTSLENEDTRGNELHHENSRHGKMFSLNDTRPQSLTDKGSLVEETATVFPSSSRSKDHYSTEKSNQNRAASKRRLHRHSVSREERPCKRSNTRQVNHHVRSSRNGSSVETESNHRGTSQKRLRPDHERRKMESATKSSRVEQFASLEKNRRYQSFGNERAKQRKRPRTQSERRETNITSMSKNRLLSHGKPRRQNTTVGKLTKQVEDHFIAPLKYTALKEICDQKDKNEGMLLIISKKERYVALLNSKEEIRDDLFKLIIDSLIVVVESVNRPTEAISILTQTNKAFLGVLNNFILDLPSKKFSSDAELEALVKKITTIFKAMLQRISYMVRYALPMSQLCEKVKEFHSEGRATEELLECVQKTNDLLKEEIKRGNQKGNDSPPDDFRQVRILPNEMDFQSGVKPFLRVNVIDGAYTDVNHYLDVQFRLLREDLIIPLRNGIKQQRSERRMSNHGESQVKNRSQAFVYKNVKIMNPVCNPNGGVYRIRIDVQKGVLRHVNWRKSKRLKFGALVCLSPDFFDSLFFGTVENRDPCGLENGELEIRFEQCNQDFMRHCIAIRISLQMIESEAYFESYKHNLTVLQQIDEENFPFKESIVYCRKEISPPKYLMDEQLQHSSEEEDKEDTARVTQSSDHSGSIDLDAPEDTVLKDDQEKYMNFTSIADKAHVEGYNLDVSRVPALDLEQWPSKEALGLDESQYRACQLALTNRFALIQGPPGTGKTYVGLKIAHALLENPALWNDERSLPILMVAYTNHALDQFLMGIKNKQGIVRVGGRSRVEELQQFSLKTLRQQMMYATTRHPHHYLSEKWRTLNEKSRIEQLYHPKQASRLIADSENAVLSVSMMERRIEAEHLRCFENEFFYNHDRYSSLDDVLLSWLGVERQNHPRRKKTGRPDPHYNDKDEDDEDVQSASVIACSLQDAKNPGWLRKNLQSDHCMSVNEVVNTELYKRNIFQLTHDERWQLYRVWRNRIATDYQLQIYKCQDVGYEDSLRKLEEIKVDENLEILRSARVIGMTTTCAAKNRTLLKRVRPKIVIVEEAAEVLEAHILTSLPVDCEHVILIGDHQQLRPSCTVYKLAEEFKLNISMFERLVNLGMPCERLSEQHRMRPDIASLMKHIYKDLHNHTSVNDYEDIRGFQHNIFFIDHKYPEQENEDTHSHVNKHEAEFLVKVCRYLTQQGYEPHQITILTPYLGQMFTIKENLEENLGEDEKQMVRLSTIDNYQGEENDIILLSLVRSNDAGQAGFVKDINRACVALSRARMGLYVIGNFKLLAKASEIWKKVVKDLKEKGQFGEALPLVCQSHKKEILVTEPKEFDDKVPCGGCTIPCQARLACGHACTRACHPYDEDHLLFRCMEQCTKTIAGCTYGHVCQNLCCELCENKCTQLVERSLQCGHSKQAQCSAMLGQIQCDERCERFLQCSHQCQSKCGLPCTLACNELVKRTDWSCGHEVTIACSATPLQCGVPCSLLTRCGHKCSGKCGECLQGRVHKPCKKICGRTLICGHQCTARCTDSCPPCDKTCETKCIHSKCKNKCGQLCVPCGYRCHWECEHQKCGMKCGEVCVRPRCNEWCLKVPSCTRHVCRGLCGDSCICVICHKDKIQEIFGTEDLENKSVRFIQLEDCKHIFEVTGFDQWMDTENTDESGENKTIQMKACPVCKTPIRTTMRYKQVVNKQLKDIEDVKKVILGDERDLDNRRERLEGKLAIYLEGIMNEGRHLRDCNHKLNKPVQTCKTNFALTLLENQVTLLVRCHRLIKKVLVLKEKQRDGTSQDKKEIISIVQILEYLKTTRIVGCNVERELKDVELEIHRQSLCFEVINLVSDTKEKAIDLKPEHQELLGGLTRQLCQASRIEETELDLCLSKVKEARSKYPIDPPTREEKNQIVKAIGLVKGHWFKCPEGHIYAIGGCGGAMERGTCPECRAVIGGASHRLAEGNQLATEMDGSRFPAWSEQANLENYEIGDLR